MAGKLPSVIPAVVLKAIDNAASEIRSFTDECEMALEERSEKWRETDAGEAYAEWVAAWSEFADQIESQPDDEFTG